MENQLVFAVTSRNNDYSCLRASLPHCRCRSCASLSVCRCRYMRCQTMCIHAHRSMTHSHQLSQKSTHSLSLTLPRSHSVSLTIYRVHSPMHHVNWLQQLATRQHTQPLLKRVHQQVQLGIRAGWFGLQVDMLALAGASFTAVQFVADF